MLFTAESNEIASTWRGYNAIIIEKCIIMHHPSLIYILFGLISYKGIHEVHKNKSKKYVDLISLHLLMFIWNNAVGK